MLPTPLKRLVARLRRSDAEARTGAEADDGSRFVPSPLDRSVRKGHGGGDDEAARELTRVDERARRLEEGRRDR